MWSLGFSAKPYTKQRVLCVAYSSTELPQHNRGWPPPGTRKESQQIRVYVFVCCGGGAMRSNNIFFYKFPIRASQHFSQKFPFFIKSLYTKDRNSVIINVNIIYYIRLIIILNSRFLNCFSYFFNFWFFYKSKTRGKYFFQSFVRECRMALFPFTGKFIECIIISTLGNSFVMLTCIFIYVGNA